MVCIEIVTIGGSQGVQVFMMTPLVTLPTSGFSTKNLVPYFQPPTWNPTSRFSNSKGGIPMKGDGNPLHGGGEPLGGGSRPLGGGGVPLGASGPPSGGGPLSGGGFPGGGGLGGFLVGGACVPFDAPWLGPP
jgi:hypothetical protein